MRLLRFSGCLGLPAFTVAVTLMAKSSAFAQLLAYDGFDYSAGTQLWGLNANGSGGAGWAANWSATSAAVATNFSPGLTYSTMPTTGGGVVFGNPAGSTATTASSQRLLPNTFGTMAASGSGSVWVSFLYQNWSTSNGGLSGFREAKLALFSGATGNANGSANVNGTERLDVGTPNTYAAGASDTLSLWQGSTFASSGVATPRGANPANTVFVVLRLDVDNTTGNDTAYAWFNPSLASQPTIGTAISFNSQDLSGVNGLRFQAGNLNASGTNAVFEIDELRVGLTWGDMVSTVVVPEPTGIALTGLAFTTLAFFRRRRS